MATSIMISSVPARGRAISPSTSGVRRRRRFSPQTGHALQILGRAIEYLSDEVAHQGVPVSADDPRLEAVKLLMALNHEVYFSCPEVPTLAERVRGWLHGEPWQRAA